MEETETIEEVMKRLGKGEGTITYGLAGVEEALQMGAIEKLIVADCCTCGMLRRNSGLNLKPSCVTSSGTTPKSP